jgi:sulfur carrier protein ThiS
MPKATLRFYEELNDCLPEKMRKAAFTHFFDKPTSIKELIESIGIPPEEVDLILVNGISVDFSYMVKDKDRVSVYPIFETFDISGVTNLRDEPLRKRK